MCFKMRVTPQLFADITLKFKTFQANECYKILSGDSRVNPELRTNVSEDSSISVIGVNAKNE